MRLLLWLVALMAAAIGVAVTARFNPGNVVFFYPPHRIDMSLNLFVVLTAVLFMVMYGMLRALRATVAMPGKVAAYRQRKRERDGNKGLRDALKALFEGRFGHAEKAAIRAAELPENAWPGCADRRPRRAPHAPGERAATTGWLGVVNDNALKTARLMTMTELLVDDHQPEAALDAVAELNASGQRHIHALQWSMKAHQQAKNWPEVLRLVRSLDKHKALHPALSSRLRELAYEALLSDSSHDAESIMRVWSTVPSADRVKPYIAARAATALNARGLHDEARHCRRSAARRMGRPCRARLPRRGRGGRIADAVGPDRALRNLDQAAPDRRRIGAHPRFAVPGSRNCGVKPSAIWSKPCRTRPSRAWCVKPI
ncbi:heme biosynthesis protein HemY [Massilia sp. H-1]|nr:heme biosynthesis protein HemY [Massilia sp. H-1]